MVRFVAFSIKLVRTLKNDVNYLLAVGGCRRQHTSETWQEGYLRIEPIDPRRLISKQGKAYMNEEVKKVPKCQIKLQ